MNKKSGISMLNLLITIIVVIILASTITVSVSILSARHNLSVFVNNILVIEEYIKSCNVLKEELPFNGELTLDEVKERIDIEYLENFNKEITNNGEISTISFRKIDMSKIGVDKKYTGYEKDGLNDVYIYSEVTGIVYYLKGVKDDENVYFSVNENVINTVK